MTRAANLGVLGSPNEQGPERESVARLPPSCKRLRVEVVVQFDFRWKALVQIERIPYEIRVGLVFVY